MKEKTEVNDINENIYNFKKKNDFSYETIGLTPEIIKEISKMIWQSLEIYYNENDYGSNGNMVSRILNEVIPYIENDDKKTALLKLDSIMGSFTDKYENMESHKESDFQSNRSISEIQYMRYEENKLSRNPKSYRTSPKKERKVNWRKEIKINKMDKEESKAIVDKEYHSFLNPLEEMLFYQYIGLKKELAYISI